jgi:salicylate hydroxylase
MSIEDAAVLGAVMQGWPGNDGESPSLRERLDVYEFLRKERTARVVERGNTQQWLYHLEDGEEQVVRDRMIRNEEEGEALAWRDKGLGPWLLGYRVEEDVARGWEEMRRRKRKSTTAAIEKL